MKKVALVHDFLHTFGGAERVLRQIAQLFPAAPIYCLQAKPAVSALFPGHQIIPALPKFYSWQLARLPSLIESFPLSDYDLVISSSNSFAHGVITTERTVHLSYCYSPARYLWDYRFEYLMERQLTGYQLPVLGPVLHYLRLWDSLAADRPDSYLAPSQTTAQRINKYYRQTATVIHPPVELERFRPGSKADFYLMVTRLSEYKKVDLVIKTLNRLNRRLLIVGEGRDRSRLERLITTPRIKLLGWQSDEAVSALLSQARALIHPQLEDFGLTVIEALASGTPVIAYRAGGATETMTEAHGVFFDEQSQPALLRAIRQFESRRFATTALVRQARRFNLNRFHRRLMEHIHAVLPHPRRDA